MLDPQGLNAPPPASSETPKAASNNTTANTTDESVTLSRLSGDELLSILRQSLAVGAKRAAKQPAAPEVPRPPVDAGASIPLVAADKDTKGLCASSLASGLRLGAASQETLVGASDVDAEEPYCPAGGEEGDPASLSAKSVPFPSSLAPFSAPSTSKDSSASTMYTSASASTPMDEDVELSTNAFLKDVLSEGVAQTSHMTPNIGPQLPFLLGSISAALGLAENLSFQHTQLLSEQEALKSNTLVKRAALKSIGDKTRLAKEQYENALRHLDLATIAFKDAEAAETSLEARLNIAAEMKERANSRVSQAIKEARALCLSVPLEWVDLVGPHIVRLVEGTPKSSHLSDSLTPPEPSPLRVQTFDFGELLTPTASSSTDRRVTGPGQPTVQFTMSPSSGSPASSVSVSRQGHGARRVTSSSSESALSRAPPLSSHSSSSTTSLKRRADDICVAFNQGACTLSSDTCDKTHSCLFCSGAHPVIRCGPEKSSERIFCVQWNVDESKCTNSRCRREHRCLRCCSLTHSIARCPIPVPSKGAVGFCFLFNASSMNFCSNRECRRDHFCLRCGEKHGSLNCPSNVMTYVQDERQGFHKKPRPTYYNGSGGSAPHENSNNDRYGNSSSGASMDHRGVRQRLGDRDQAYSPAGTY